MILMNCSIVGALLIAPSSYALDGSDASAAKTVNVVAFDPAASPLGALLGRINPVGWLPTAVSSRIDGDPDRSAILAEFGCQYAFAKTYQRGQRQIQANVYCFTSSQGAYGAYNLLRRGSSTVLTKGDASSEDDQSVSIWKDRIFITVFGTSEDDEESKGAVSAVADQLSSAIISHGQLPAVISRMPMIDRIKGSEKIVMGPVSGRRLFPAPSLGLLALGAAQGAGVADYQFQAPFRERMKMLLVEYGNSTLAAQAFNQYVQALQGQHPNIIPEDDGSTALFKLASTYIYCQLKAQRLLIITGAHKRPSSMMLARQVI